MAVICSEEGRTLTARIEGEVDHHAARRMMEELSGQIDSGLPRFLELDLSGVSFMDSSGIAVLLRAWHKMRQLDGGMRVRGVPHQAAKVLRAAGLDKIIPFEE